MYITSPQMEEKLWRRLLAISVEDVGMGNPQMAVNCSIFKYNEKRIFCMPKPRSGNVFIMQLD